MTRSLAMLSALPLPALAATARAQTGPTGFQSPSKNIACQFFDYDKQNTLRCDIMEATVTARRPSDCDLEWGKAFEMNSKGTAGRICYGDTVIDKSLPVLAYGEVWQRGGFTCRSEQTGLTCFNAMQHGFSLSRVEQKLF